MAMLNNQRVYKYIPSGNLTWWPIFQPSIYQWLFMWIKANYHLVMTNIAMENPNHKWRFVAGKIIYKWAIFHGYVK